MNLKTPVYLGVHRKGKVPVWCFIAVKDGVGRFVRYINYPLWSRGSDMPDTLDLKIQPPENILEDVGLFIEGKIAFHELPPKRGRRRRIIRTILGDVCGPGGTQSDQRGRADDVGQSLSKRERGADRSGLSILPDEASRDRKKRKVRGRQLRSPSLQESSRGSVALVTPDKVGRAVAAAIAAKVLPMEPIKGVEIVRRKRGRPKKVK